MKHFPDVRLRRLRRTQTLRDLTGLSFPSPEKFVWPVFLVEGKNKAIPIDAMPEQFRFSIDKLVREIKPVIQSGVNTVLLFAALEEHKNPDGRYAHNEEGLVQQGIRALRCEYPDLIIFTDVCLCSYTDHGHCGVLDNNGNVENDLTLDILNKVAVSHADAGADGVAPSAMMDGQVASIRRALDSEGFQNTVLMSYSTKFASSFYGPFREAAKSSPEAGDRQAYQASYNNPRLALRESLLDIEEGADILMVKPSMVYLDIIAKLRDETQLPLAAYNVSGEYSMIIASAHNGWGDLNGMVRESIMALKRAGTDIFISYWANQYKKFGITEKIANCTSA
jgi:porphobilinogen synthase